MHSNGKGISDSALHYKRTQSSWLKTTAEEVVKQGAFFCTGGSDPAAAPPRQGALSRHPHLPNPPTCTLHRPATALRRPLPPACSSPLPSPSPAPPSPPPRQLPPTRAVAKLSKRGLQPSQIGVLLRDEQGIAQVKAVTGKKILRVLKAEGLAPTLPEDLYHLIKKAVSVRKHLERNRNDKDSKFRLILIESRIHRIAR